MTMFHIHKCQLYTLEFWGPLSAKVYLDIDTAKVVIDLPEQTHTFDYEGGWITEEIAAGIYRVETAESEDDAPTLWHCHEVEGLPADRLPIQLSSTKPALRSLDDDWQ